MRDFRKVLVILPTSACVGAASDALWRVAAGQPAEPQAIYQALYAKGPEREAARHPGQHTLAGGLTSIFSETRTRLQNDHRREPKHALGAKTTSSPTARCNMRLVRSAYNRGLMRRPHARVSRPCRTLLPEGFRRAH